MTAYCIVRVAQKNDPSRQGIGFIAYSQAAFSFVAADNMVIYKTLEEAERAFKIGFCVCPSDWEIKKLPSVVCRLLRKQTGTNFPRGIHIDGRIL
jgi:hypothetical protein